MAQGHGLPLYLVGGSCRAFARYAIDATGWPLDDPHGFELDTATAIGAGRHAHPATEQGAAASAGPVASRLASLPDAAR